MGGYRESSYDPLAYERPGRPLRPFNWVQWTGVAMLTVGSAYTLAFIAARLGLVRPFVTEMFPGFILCILGSTFITSRREPGTQVGEEQLRRNRKVMLITVAILAALGAALLIFEFARS